MAQVPSALAEAIYSGVQGAHLAPYEGQSTWFVPCDAELNMTLVFGGQKVFIHPLDMVITTDGNAINATSTCVGAVRFLNFILALRRFPEASPAFFSVPAKCGQLVGRGIRRDLGHALL